MSIESEDMLNEVEIWLDRTSAAVSAVDHIDGSYKKGVLDGIRMVTAAVKHMKEELA